MQDTKPVFKKCSFSDSPVNGSKKRTWKSLKQILTTERTLQWPDTAVTCGCDDKLCLFPEPYCIRLPADSSINAPPSFRPAKKYSDISGLIATYTDPQTKLHYHNAEEFAIIRNFPGDLTQGYLTLRGAASIVG